MALNFLLQMLVFFPALYFLGPLPAFVGLSVGMTLNYIFSEVRFGNN